MWDGTLHTRSPNRWIPPIIKYTLEYDKSQANKLKIKKYFKNMIMAQFMARSKCVNKQNSQNLQNSQAHAILVIVCVFLITL